MSAYLIYLSTLFAIVAISAIALNLALGWAGIINLGHMGLVAVGGYTSAVLTTAHGAPVLLGLLAGMAASAVVAALLGLLTHSVRDDMLGVILLGFTFAVYTIALNWTDVTRGSLGIPGIPRPGWLAADTAYLAFALACLAVVVLVVLRVTRSPYGRVLGALRDDELHARVLGKRAFRVKVQVLALAGGLAGLAGGLEAHFIRFINPQGFFLTQQVLILSAVFVGGLASVPGSLAGSAVVVFVPEIARAALDLPTSEVGALRGMLFSALLVLVVLFRPKGIAGRIELPSSYAERD